MKTLYNSFVVYRQEIKFFAGITAQTIALETYLNIKLDKEFNRIKIIHSTEDVIYTFNDGESNEVEYTFNDGEIGIIIYTFFEGEGNSLIEYDYQVKYPNTIELTSITAEILKFNLAGRRFQLLPYSIITQDYQSGEETNQN